ncbi:MAG: hypothetical protein RL160_1891 [Bacteroidota bacterium]|jgi:ATP-dependent DNA helicase RecG
MDAKGFLDTPISNLHGLSPERVQLMQKEMEVFTFGDLLQYYPFRYEDRSRIYAVSELHESQAGVTLRGFISDVRMAGAGRSQRLVARFSDQTGDMELVWFQGVNWISKSLTTGGEYLIFGKPQQFGRKFSISHPELEKIQHGKLPASRQHPLMPVYPMTEAMRRRRMDHKAIAGMVKQVLQLAARNMPEFIPVAVMQHHKLMNRGEAFWHLHVPSDLMKLEEARRRMKFEELFLLQLRIFRIRGVQQRSVRGIPFPQIGNHFNDFYAHKLPFQLTEAQKKVLREIRSDLGSGQQMNRLLQGDVGSGKTVVALMSMLMALDNNCQAALMAPTEILAYQHYESICDLLGDMPVEVRLLTGSTTKKAREEILEGLAGGRVNILIGTHALLESDVRFQKLGLVVIDEQHRFGVAQRSKLWEKGNPVPHVMVMTATPIPRTLAMTAYGDLDHSVINELPKGRKPIRTVHRYDHERPAFMQFIKEEIAKGRQVYFVFPLIEESPKLELKNLMEGHDMVSSWFPIPQYQIGIVHGRMKAAEKDAEMMRFKKGITQIMVATTVIEVGVNVPNASVMVIEDADRFGLSQLHQLRGRVGRGSEQSYCILTSKAELSANARRRLQTMCTTNDGFEIARVDMELRGPGDLEGTRQSGLLDLKLSDLIKDEPLLMQARETAAQLLQADPDLQKPEHALLLQRLLSQQGKTVWSRIL